MDSSTLCDVNAWSISVPITEDTIKNRMKDKNNWSEYAYGTVINNIWNSTKNAKSIAFASEPMRKNELIKYNKIINSTRKKK